MTVWQQIVDVVQRDFADLGDAAMVVRIVLRLLMAAAVGGMLGYEREARGKAAGVRTHMLVALGAAVFIVAPIMQGADNQAISRVIQGLVAGIGFLGAGSIVKGHQDSKIHGLTTAASIWMAAALGMTVGLGRSGIAVLGAALSLLILRVIPADIHPPRVE